MRLLTPEQQAQVPDGERIGTLCEQGLAESSAGSTYTLLVVDGVADRRAITDWRHAIAVGCVSRSRFGEWEPFRTKAGAERVLRTPNGRAFASDGVHILIQRVDGGWISRSAQVVTFIVEAPYAGKDFVRVKATEYLKAADKENIKPKRVDSLVSEYLSM